MIDDVHTRLGRKQPVRQEDYNRRIDGAVRNDRIAGHLRPLAGPTGIVTGRDRRSYEGLHRHDRAESHIRGGVGTRGHFHPLRDRIGR